MFVRRVIVDKLCCRGVRIQLFVSCVIFRISDDRVGQKCGSVLFYLVSCAGSRDGKLRVGKCKVKSVDNFVGRVTISGSDKAIKMDDDFSILLSSMIRRRCSFDRIYRFVLLHCNNRAKKIARVAMLEERSREEECARVVRDLIGSFIGGVSPPLIRRKHKGRDRK